MSFGESQRSTGEVVVGAVLRGEGVSLRLPAPVAPTRFRSWPLSPWFIGRDAEQAALVAALDPETAGPGRGTVCMLTGPTGAGKTELALRTAAAAADRGWYPGGILLVDMAGADVERCQSPERALGTLLLELGVPGEHVPHDLQGRIQLYQTVLSAFAEQGRRVLVIVDGVATANQARPLAASTGTIVVSPQTLPGFEASTVDVGTLHENDSVDLLNRILSSARESDTRLASASQDADEIAELCGYLPLALRLVGAALAGTVNQPLGTVAGILRTDRDRSSGDSENDRAVRAAVNLSYNALNADDAGLLRLFCGLPGTDTATEAVAFLKRSDTHALRAALDRLAGAGLIEENVSGGRWRLPGSIRRHLAEHVESHADDDQRTKAIGRVLRHFARTASAAVAAAGFGPAKAEDPYYAIDTLADGGLRLTVGGVKPAKDGFADSASALAWLAAEHDNLVAVVVAAERWRPEVARELPTVLSRYLRGVQRQDDWDLVMRSRARAVHERDRAERAAEEDSADEPAGDIRDAEPAQPFDDSVEVARNVVATERAVGNRRGQAAALSRLGSACYEAGRFSDAVEAFREAADLYEKTGQGSGQASALNNLGGALQRLNRHQEAIGVHERVVGLFEESGDGHGQAGALMNLASALRGSGRLAESVEAGRRAVAAFHTSGDRHAEGLASRNLGLALDDMHRYEEAVRAFQAASVISRETADRRLEASAAADLGWALAKMRRFEEAVKELRSASEIHIEAGEDLLAAAALDGLGEALRQTGRIDEAIEAHQRALRTYRAAGDVGGTVKTLIGLGAGLHAAGRFDAAARTHSQAVGLGREHGDHRRLGSALDNLGADLQMLGRLDAAIRSHQEAAVILERIGDAHGEAGARSNLGVALDALGRKAQSARSFLESAALYQRAGDRYHEARVLCEAGRALVALGRSGEALGPLRQAVDGFRNLGRRGDEGHALLNLAEALGHVDRLGEERLVLLRAQGVYSEIGDADTAYAIAMEVRRLGGPA